MTNPKFALVPIEATKEMIDTGQHVNSEWLNDSAPLGEGIYRDPAKAVYENMLAKSPNGGEVSREQLEELAACEHDQWRIWAGHMLENMTDENIRRWKKQILTPYEDLSEGEKDLDRVFAERSLSVLNLRVEGDG